MSTGAAGQMEDDAFTWLQKEALAERQRLHVHDAENEAVALRLRLTDADGNRWINYPTGTRYWHPRTGRQVPATGRVWVRRDGRQHVCTDDMCDAELQPSATRGGSSVCPISGTAYGRVFATSVALGGGATISRAGTQNAPATPTVPPPEVTGRRLAAAALRHRVRRTNRLTAPLTTVKLRAIDDTVRSLLHTPPRTTAVHPTIIVYYTEVVRHTWRMVVESPYCGTSRAANRLNLNHHIVAVLYEMRTGRPPILPRDQWLATQLPAVSQLPVDMLPGDFTQASRMLRAALSSMFDSGSSTAVDRLDRRMVLRDFQADPPG